MGLIARIRHRVGYVWYWRARYWWLDTRQGLIARLSLAVMALIAIMGDTIYLIVKAQQPAPAAQPKESIIWFVVYLIIALVIAVIAIATMPKPKGPQPTQASTPTTTDGQQVVDAFGTVWTDDSFILAWKQMGTEAIKASGGK